MYDAFTSHIKTLFLLLSFCLIAAGTGSWTLSKLRITCVSQAENIFYGTSLGLILIGYSVFILGTVQSLSPLSLYTLLFIFGSVSCIGIPRLCKERKRHYERVVTSPWDRLLLPLLFVGLLGGLAVTLTPEIGKDALIYHLAVPKRFLSHGGIYTIEGNIFSHYPLHSEMLFLLGLFFGGDVLAKGMHFAALLLVLFGMYQFSRSTYIDNRFPFLSMTIFLTIPTVFITSTSAYNDIFVTLYAISSLFAFITWFHRGENAWLALCGLFSGGAIGSKYTCLLLPLLIILGILWSARTRALSNQKALSLLFLYISTAAVAGSPFYIKNWITTGNPFSPFLSSIFGGTGWEPEQARWYDLFVRNLGMGRGILDYLLLPWNVSFRAEMNSPRFDGILGPIFLFTLPFAFGMRSITIAMKMMLTYCFITFLFWASTAQQMRYLIPLFPILAIITGTILTWYAKTKNIWFGLLTCLIVGSILFNIYYTVRELHRIQPLGVVVGKESRDAFLNRVIPSYVLFHHMNTHLPTDSKILLIYMKNLTYLCERECYSDSMFESYTIQKIISHFPSPEGIRRELMSRGFTHILYDRNYVYGPLSTFSQEEKFLFSEFEKRYLIPLFVKEPYSLSWIRNKDSYFPS